jgi:heptosyltransferase II
VAEVQEWPFAHRRLDAGARWRLAQSLRGQFDRAYVLPNSLKAALVPWLAGVPLRVGYRGEGRIGLLNRRRPNPAGRPAMVETYAALAEVAEPTAIGPQTALAAPADDDPMRPRLRLSAALRDSVRAPLGLAAGGYRVFAPGAEYGPSKCWPGEHYAALARQLSERDGRPVLLLGSAKEAPACEAIAADAGPVCRSLAGRTRLDEAFALVADAHEMVSNDSGLMHVAAAFGVPQVALFGSTSPHHTPPRNPRAQVLWLKEELQLPCMPCFERTCRFGDTRCLRAIAPERVAALVQP